MIATLERPRLLSHSNAFGEDVTGAWHVLHTRSRQEKVLAADLSAMGIPHFLPLLAHQRTYGRRKAVVEEPLFPGYLFLRGELDDVYRADRTRRIARFIHPNDQSRIDWELRNIYLALCKEAPFDPYPYLKKGVRVEVRSGPFQGLQGIIEDRAHNDRLVLQVDMLGRAVGLELDGALLEPLD